MLNQTDVVNKIRRVIAETLLVEVDSPETNLLEAGLLDSASTVQLVLRLEEHFQVRIELHELELEDLQSIDSIARLVETRTAGAGIARPSADVQLMKA